MWNSAKGTTTLLLSPVFLGIFTLVLLIFQVKLGPSRATHGAVTQE